MLKQCVNKTGLPTIANINSKQIKRAELNKPFHELIDVSVGRFYYISPGDAALADQVPLH